MGAETESKVFEITAKVVLAVVFLLLRAWALMIVYDAFAPGDWPHPEFRIFLAAIFAFLGIGLTVRS